MPKFGNDNVFVSSFAEVVLGNDNVGKITV